MSHFQISKLVNSNEKHETDSVNVYYFKTYILVIYNSGEAGTSVAQLQNGTIDQTQMQFGWWFMSYSNCPMNN